MYKDSAAKYLMAWWIFKRFMAYLDSFHDRLPLMLTAQVIYNLDGNQYQRIAIIVVECFVI